jgi:hypothetical protein
MNRFPRVLIRPAVGGCEYKDRDDPGNLEFDWLEVQLKYFRARDMQVRCDIDRDDCGLMVYMCNYRYG